MGFVAGSIISVHKTCVKLRDLSILALCLSVWRLKRTPLIPGMRTLDTG